ncbi:MAG: hypothetical protein V7L23_24275, partial [Nostoc sp.]|uniref:hypothetical protein n=1 Tax=Nostoc sp. TaxID=1180 RepID=UPI002FF2D742
MAYPPAVGDRTLAKRVFDHKTSQAIGSASLSFNFWQSFRFLATFGDLGWGKAEGRGQKAEVGRKKDIIK